MKTLLLIGLPQAEFCMTNFFQLEILQLFWFLKNPDLDSLQRPIPDSRSSTLEEVELLQYGSVQALLT